ncbi:hypothetical protein VCRA2121O441_140051 [Vibrio crassostreae]|nr:hypothetical protein VCRA2114O421_140051 [Vibrio crassostreae]CAK2293871.1 hypothetical protein VCRA2113O410_150052 [Vibrio crassostreae]CAK2552543.1 hypothetical protein VCRA2113O419_130052 [Vibrio crassostreae]CAK3707114.1 hypothetical protein VCRA2121O441_140051 [Vibrio crassostreae]CAK3712735.1 hypothetical protein VCRA2121O439_140051 [Vibrio crassostreae]
MEAEILSTVSQLVKMKLYRNQGFPLSAISLLLVNFSVESMK